jgi:hypothetical protein
MMVRKANTSDLAFIVNECVLAAEKNMPYAKADRNRICDVAMHLIKDRHGEIFIATHDGKPTGLLALSQVDTNWTRKKVCEVLAWTGAKPGACLATLREAITWAKTKPASSGLAMAFPCETAERMAEMLKICRFVRYGNVFFNDLKR